MLWWWCSVHATYIQPAMKSAVQVGSDRPLLAVSSIHSFNFSPINARLKFLMASKQSLATIFLALSIVPLASFTIFAVTTLLVVVGGTAAFALFWCGILIGGAGMCFYPCSTA